MQSDFLNLSQPQCADHLPGKTKEAQSGVGVWDVLRGLTGPPVFRSVPLWELELDLFADFHDGRLAVMNRNGDLTIVHLAKRLQDRLLCGI